MSVPLLSALGLRCAPRPTAPRCNEESRFLLPGWNPCDTAGVCAACHVSCRAGQWSAPPDRAVQYHHPADGSFAPPAQLLPLRVPPTLLRVTALIFVPSNGPNESSRAPAAVTRAWVLHLARTHGALEGLAGKERNDTAMHGDAEAVRPRLAVRHQPVQQSEVDHGAIRPAQDAA